MSLKFSPESFVIWKILNSFMNPHMVDDMLTPHVYYIRQQKTQKKFRLLF